MMTNWTNPLDTRKLWLWKCRLVSGIKEELISWNRSNKRTAPRRRCGEWSASDEYHLEAGRLWMRLVVFKDGGAQRTRGLIVELHRLKLLPVAIFERKTCMFSNAEKGFYWWYEWWLKPNIRSWKWDFVTLKYCEGVCEHYYHKCIVEKKKKKSHKIFYFAHLTLFFSSAPTVSVWFTEVKMLLSLFWRCFFVENKVVEVLFYFRWSLK